MMSSSIVALVDLGNHYRHHLSVDLAKSLGAPHRLAIKNIVGLEASGVQSVDPHYPIDAVVSRIDDAVFEVAKGTLPEFFVRGFNPRHHVNLNAQDR
jgi:hypothetical protein